RTSARSTKSRRPSSKRVASSSSSSSSSCCSSSTSSSSPFAVEFCPGRGGRSPRPFASSGRRQRRGNSDGLVHLIDRRSGRCLVVRLYENLGVFAKDLIQAGVGRRPRASEQIADLGSLGDLVRAALLRPVHDLLLVKPDQGP